MFTFSMNQWGDNRAMEARCPARASGPGWCARLYMHLTEAAVFEHAVELSEDGYYRLYVGGSTGPVIEARDMVESVAFLTPTQLKDLHATIDAALHDAARLADEEAQSNAG